MARECLRDTLDHSENETLSQAVEETSLGPLARAQRIAAAGRELLAGGRTSDGTDWLLRLEAIAREIDACFAADTMPVYLQEVRGEIVALLKPNNDAAASGEK